MSRRAGLRSRKIGEGSLDFKNLAAQFPPFDPQGIRKHKRKSPTAEDLFLRRGGTETTKEGARKDAGEDTEILLNPVGRVWEIAWSYTPTT